MDTSRLNRHAAIPIPDLPRTLDKGHLWTEKKAP